MTLLASLFSLCVQAKPAELSYYVFENHGTASSAITLLENKDTPIKPTAAWFDWACTAHMQADGVLMDCKRNDEYVETKVYCDLPQGRFGRLIRFGKGENFITFEARCSLKKAKAAKRKKAAAPPAEVPNLQQIPPSPAPENQPIAPPEN